MTADDKITAAVAEAIATGKPSIRETIHGPEKYCGPCDEWWPADREFFHIDAGGVGGLKHCCIACVRETNTRSRAAAALQGAAA